jgi:hypothetical protein
MSNESGHLTCLCNHCSQSLEFPSEGIGTEIQCPTCGMTTRLYRAQVAPSNMSAPAYQEIEIPQIAASGMPVPAPASHYQCPRCSSPEIQAFPMLHMSGISKTSMIGVASDGEIGGMSGNTQSLLSALATPPKKRGEADGVALAIGGCVAGFFIYAGASACDAGTGGFIAFLIIGIGSIAGGIALHRANDKWNKWEYPPRFRKWKHSWLCKRCGTTWQRSE